MKMENSNRTRMVGIRFTVAEYEILERKWKSTTCRKLSDYIRKHLFHKPITTNIRNESIDEFMLEITRLKMELSAIGNNFNQSVKRLHTLQQIPEFRIWITRAEADRKVLFHKVDQIKNEIEKMAKKWLLS